VIALRAEPIARRHAPRRSLWVSRERTTDDWIGDHLDRPNAGGRAIAMPRTQPSCRGGGRLHGPDDAQVEPREVDVGRRAIASVEHLTTGSPRKESPGRATPWLSLWRPNATSRRRAASRRRASRRSRPRSAPLLPSPKTRSVRLLNPRKHNWQLAPADRETTASPRRRGAWLIVIARTAQQALVPIDSRSRAIVSAGDTAIAYA